MPLIGHYIHKLNNHVCDWITQIWTETFESSCQSANTSLTRYSILPVLQKEWHCYFLKCKYRLGTMKILFYENSWYYENSLPPSNLFHFSTVKYSLKGIKKWTNGWLARLDSWFLVHVSNIHAHVNQHRRRWKTLSLFRYSLKWQTTAQKGGRKSIEKCCSTRKYISACAPIVRYVQHAFGNEKYSTHFIRFGMRSIYKSVANNFKETLRAPKC